MRLVLLALTLAAAPAQAQERMDVCLDDAASRYIGETEKNLGRVFEMAAQTDVALSFDEADALFAGRTHVRQGRDRYDAAPADRLIARIERFARVERLASNGRRMLVAGFDRRAHGAGLIVMETETGARAIEFARADRAAALRYADATLRACPPDR